MLGSHSNTLDPSEQFDDTIKPLDGVVVKSGSSKTILPLMSDHVLDASNESLWSLVHAFLTGVEWNVRNFEISARWSISVFPVSVRRFFVNFAGVPPGVLARWVRRSIVCPTDEISSNRHLRSSLEGSSKGGSWGSSRLLVRSRLVPLNCTVPIAPWLGLLGSGRWGGKGGGGGGVSCVLVCGCLISCSESLSLLYIESCDTCKLLLLPAWLHWASLEPSRGSAVVSTNLGVTGESTSFCIEVFFSVDVWLSLATWLLVVIRLPWGLPINFFWRFCGFTGTGGCGVVEQFLLGDLNGPSFSSTNEGCTSRLVGWGCTMPGIPVWPVSMSSVSGWAGLVWDGDTLAALLWGASVWSLRGVC